jgi:hypothetical protein
MISEYWDGGILKERSWPIFTIWYCVGMRFLPLLKLILSNILITRGAEPWKLKVYLFINPLKTERNLFYIRTQPLPHSKDSRLRL